MTRLLLQSALLFGLLLLFTLPASAEPKGRIRQLPGAYYAQYNVLFSETGEIRAVEKFLEIETTEDPFLFLYSQCWRLLDGGDWNHERGGLVVTESGRRKIDFSVVEVEFGVEEGSTGFMLGHMSSKNRLEMSYHGLLRGIVFHMLPRRVKDVELDEFSCPVD